MAPQQLPDLLDSFDHRKVDPDYPIDPDTYKEQKGSGPWYAADFPEMTRPVPFRSENEEIFIISDLHIAAGRDALGVYNGSENFFADEALERFLAHADGLATASGKPALLIINGDSFDFLRVIDTPSTGEIPTWQQELIKLNIPKSIKELTASVSKRELTYGLETDDYKTIFKLMKIREGHPVIFAALGAWVGKGHRLLMIKGNHDLEMVWPATRNYIRLLIAEEIAAQTAGTSLESILLTKVMPKIHFRDDAVLIGEDLYLEHGHRYDKFTMVLDSPIITIKGADQINIPFGSFFNRYLINRLELAYPFLDKVRPGSNVLPILIRDNFPLAIKVFGQYLPLLVRILRTNKRYVWFMLRRVIPLIIAALPVAVCLIWLIIRMLPTPGKAVTNPDATHIVLNYLTKGLLAGASLAASYFLSRLVAHFQLVEPSSLDDYARHVISKSGRKFPLMTMGHTHNPSACAPTTGGRFYNSGTWIPVIEIATAEVREDKTYTFLHVATDAKGGLIAPENLQRWNDDAGRADPQLIIQPK